LGKAESSLATKLHFTKAHEEKEEPRAETGTGQVFKQKMAEAAEEEFSAEGTRDLLFKYQGFKT